MFETWSGRPTKYIPLLRSSRNILSGGAINILSLRDCAKEKSCSQKTKSWTFATQRAFSNLLRETFGSVKEQIF